MGKIPDSPENELKCICPDCPSFDQCMKDKSEILYCARERSDCYLTKNGCLCGACPIASEFGLDKMYYCEIGAEE